MSAPQHTPGPWVTREGQLIRVSPAGSVEVICGVHRVGSRTRGEKPGEAIANARLIAAAPELLDALEALRREVANYGNIGHEGSALLEIMSDARAAIAKARGER